MFVCLFEAVRTNPGYGMATLISNNLLNLISGMLAWSSGLDMGGADSGATS